MSKGIQVSDGVVKDIIREGGPTQVQPKETITVNCTAWLATDPPKKFWSTKDPGQQPFSFQVGMKQVITGWDEGCLSMKKGEIALLKIRSDKAYGKSGFPGWGIPPDADLQFEIEIL